MANLNSQVNKAHATAWKILGVIIVAGVCVKEMSSIGIILAGTALLLVVFRKQVAKIADHKINAWIKSHSDKPHTDIEVDVKETRGAA